ncbi:MAG: FAD-binding oxidoreductase [Actinomycetota bacterium]
MAGSVAVVGSGIIGTTTAWKLQMHGAQTTLIGEPLGASFASFASLTAFDEPLTEVYSLKCLGMSYWRRWDREFDNKLGLSWDGEIRWAETPESAQALSNKIAQAVRRGYSVRSMSTEELSERLPNSRPGQVLEASLAPDDGQADPAKSIAQLRKAFQDAGGRIVPGLAKLQCLEQGVLVKIGDEELEVETVVVAGGASTATILKSAGTELPMDPSPGLLVTTEPAEPVLTGTVYVSPVTWPAIHLRQLPDGRVLIGERSQDYAATRPTINHARELLRQAQRSFPALGSAQIEDYTVEWRPMPRDGMPVIGRLPGVPSIYVATGHSGVTLAPAIAALVAYEIVDDLPAIQLESFRPSRFADQRTYLAREVESAFNGEG